MMKYILLLFLGNLVCITVSSQVIDDQWQDKITKRQMLRKEARVSELTSGKSHELRNTSVNSHLKLDSLIEYNRNSETQLWDQRYIKQTFQYNENHKEVLWMYSSWNDETNTWNELMKEESDYYPNGNLKGYTNYVWGVNGKWDGFSKEVYQYDERNRLQETTLYSWKNSLEDWMAISVTKYSYNEGNKLSEDSTYWRSASNENWDIQSKNEYTYIHNGLLHHIYQSEYNPTSDSWDLMGDIWYLYDNIKWLLHSITDYDLQNETWVRKEMEGMIYNDDDWLYGSGIVSWSHSEGVSEILKMKRSYYDYDFDVAEEGLILPYYLKNADLKFYHHKVDSRRLYLNELETNTWKQYRSINYYYSDVDRSTSIDHFQNSSFKVYPNPANDFVYLNFKNSTGLVQFELYNISGKRVFNTMVHSADQFDVSHIPTGMYLFVVTINGKKEKGKIIIN